MEKLKIFRCDHDGGELEKKYNNWRAAQGEIEILDRRFSVHGPGTEMFLAIFYKSPT